MPELTLEKFTSQCNEYVKEDFDGDVTKSNFLHEIHLVYETGWYFLFLNVLHAIVRLSEERKK